MLARRGTRAAGLTGLVLLLGGPLLVGRAAAQGAPTNMSAAPRSTCGTSNLLSGKRPSHWQDVRGNTGLLTDGELAPEGAQWDAPVAVVFETGAGSVTYDLGEPIPITALYLQADANDSYKVQGSLDGTPGSFKLLVEIDNAFERGHGLRARWARIPPMAARFLRVGEGVGDGFYSISEFAAYCEAPSPFPPAMSQVSAPLAAVATRAWYMFDWWEDHASARLEMGLAVFALLLVGWGYWAQRSGKDFALGAAAPTWVLMFCIAVHLAIAASIRTGTNLLPRWVVFATLYLSWELSLLVAPRPAGLATPMGFVVGWLHGRGRKRGIEVAGIGSFSSPPSHLKPARSTAYVRDQLLVLVGILSFLAYWNFGAFHFGNYVHYWDTYHYYVGSKYFNEMSYDRLYECASVADSEEPSLRRRVELRKIMNLRTNVLGSTTDILAHPERCKQHFSPERWEMFRKDIAFFRNHHGVKRWEEAQTDHGYNATPVWNIVGTTLANLSPASDTQVGLLTRIDPAFIVGMTLMIGWAFGWRVLCVALAVFATNFPSRFYWTGGAYLRWDWLFYMTAGVCLIKKDRPLLGGYLCGYSALERVFPGFLFLGPLFGIAHQLIDSIKGRKSRRQAPWDLPALPGRASRSHLAVILGGLLAVATLVPLSLVTSDGVSAYRMFVQNSKKHTSTPLTNYMGWRTVVTYKEREAGRYLRTDRLEDPWKAWKDARLRTFHQRKLVYQLGVLGFAAFLFLAVRGLPAWEATALGSIMIAVVPELTCYYYSFLIVLALLYARRKEVGLALLAVTAATGFIDWAPTQFLPRTSPWIYLQMPTWLDEQYTWMSVMTLLGIGFILYWFRFVPGANPSTPAAPVLVGGVRADPSNAGIGRDTE